MHQLPQLKQLAGAASDGQLLHLLTVESFVEEGWMSGSVQGPAPTGPDCALGAGEFHGLVVLEGGQRL